jgi:uncharacterized membrane protein YccF (DUF307 family)
MNLLANILWIFLGGGIILFFEYIIGGILLCLTIIGIPFGFQKFKLAIYVLAPFGQQVKYNSTPDGCLTTVSNILWILLGGVWIALTHALLAFVYAITIIGLPFSRQHLRLAGFALTPFGKTVS